MTDKIIIPAPKYIRSKNKKIDIVDKKGKLNFSFEITDTCTSPKIDIALKMINEEISSKLDIRLQINGSFPKHKEKQIQKRIFIIPIGENTSLEDEFIHKLLDKEDMKLFSGKSSNEQKYILKTQNDDTVIIAGYPQGILYGAMSLIQLFNFAPNKLSIPQVHIRDYPDIEYRAASSWLIGGEASRWSHDWGDGIDMLISRFKRKIDFCLKYKINVVFFDGFEWDANKFPGYSSAMRKLNSYAFARGIRLVYGGFGIGIGGRQDNGYGFEGGGLGKGLGGKNRKCYPDGETYKCCGDERNCNTRENGTCRSNDRLNELIKRDLAEYVRKIEPRALYIHHEDFDTMRFGRYWWDNRCESCHEKWPNDRIESINGGAGAIAHGYDILSEAVSSVRNASSGYNAANDCLIIIVSPFYGAWSESDDDWDKVVEFWKNVSVKMKHKKNILLGFREQFLRKDNNQKRIKELSESLNGIGTFTCALGGADLYSSDALYTAVPVLNHCFEGSGSIYNFCGRAFQEPQQMLNSEFTWNLKSPWFYEPSSTCEECIDIYKELFQGKNIPVEIKGKNGFLKKACIQLYGKQAGMKMFDFYTLNSGSGEYPLVFLYYQFHRKQYFTENNLFNIKDRVLVRKDRERFARINKLTQKAISLVVEAYHSPNIPGSSIEDIEFLIRFLHAGSLFSGIMAKICEKKIDKNDILKDIMGLEKYLKKAFKFDISCKGNSDLEFWPVYIRNIKAFLKRV